MAQSREQTVESYLQALPPERRAVVERVRAVILEHLPQGYEEHMAFGMISYGIPLATYPDTYNGQPLGYVALAAQKNYYALYLLGAYGDAVQQKQLEDAFAASGRKLDMGKSCIRFRKAEDLQLDALGRIIAATAPDAMIRKYEAARRR